MADLKGKVSLDNIIVQAMKIPGVKVNRAEFLRAQFASQGILVTQIVEEGPVACDYSEIELDEMASALILRRTSESSAMSFAAGLPGGLALAATIPADTLQFFAMSLRMAQELAYLYGAKDFWTCEGEEGKMVRFAREDELDRVNELRKEVNDLFPTSLRFGSRPTPRRRELRRLFRLSEDFSPAG